MPTIKFIWERAKRRKLGMFFLVLSVILFILLPDGMTDFFTVIPLIGLLGFKTYVLLTGILIFIFLSNGKVRHLLHKPTKAELRSICSKVSRTQREFRNCKVQNA